MPSWFPKRLRPALTPACTHACTHNGILFYVNMLQEGGGRSPAQCESLLPVFARMIFFSPLLLRRLLLLLPVQRTMRRLVWRAGVDQSLDADGVLNNGCMRAAEGLSSCVLAAEPLVPPPSHRPAIVCAPCLGPTGLQKPAIVFNYSRQPLKVSCPCVPDFFPSFPWAPSLSPLHSVSASVFTRVLQMRAFLFFFVMISESRPPLRPFPLLACTDAFFSCWSLLYVQGAGATSVYVDVSVMSAA